MSLILGEIVVLMTLALTGGENIMLNKPSVMSDERWSKTAANDGNRGGSVASTHSHLNPYWQGDLLSLYTIFNITMTSGYDNGRYSKNAYIGISQSGVADWIVCGQWPGTNDPGPITFNCPPGPPARFVRVWRETTDYLMFTEVEVCGINQDRRARSIFEKQVMKKVSSLSLTTSAPTVIDCSNTCHDQQPCFAFSFSSTLNTCILAANITMTTEPGWESYAVSYKCNQ